MLHLHLRAGHVLATITAGLVLAACSTGDTSAERTVSEKNAAAVRSEAARQQEVAANLAALPKSSAGRVDLAGGATRTLTTRAARDYNSSGTTNHISVSDAGAGPAFAGLCSGQVDLVDSARPISADELAACRDNGLDVVQVQVAADAIVLAAKAESDVGGDCVDVESLRTMFRAGSPVTSWRQMDFADVPLTVAGPAADDRTFDLFGQLVLGRANPVLSDIRSDYRAGASDQATRIDVVGTAADIDQAGDLTSRKQTVTALRREASAARAVYASARAEVAAAETDRQKGIADGRSAAQQAKDQARQDAAYPIRTDAQTSYNRLKAQVKAAEVEAKRSAEAQRRLSALQGRAGVFSFSYYELEKEQLRPFEITRNGVKDCIFPSQRTIAEGTYPLAQPLLVTTTTRSLQRAEVRDFMTLYLDQVDKRATDASLVPPTADILATERAWFTGESSPTLVTVDDGTDTADASPGPAR